jgi:hypothetical protein
MSAKQRIQRLEKTALKTQADTPIYQSVKNGVIHVHWLSGRVTYEAEIMPGTKTYDGICPCEWDEPKAA